MPFSHKIAGNPFRIMISGLIITFMINCQSGNADQRKKPDDAVYSSEKSGIQSDKDQIINTLLLLPANPGPGKAFRILATGDKEINKSQIILKGTKGNLKPLKSETGIEAPFWRIDNFPGIPAGKYTVALIINNKEACSLDFNIGDIKVPQRNGSVWKTFRGWDSASETMYSAWISFLFYGCDEQASWPALHEVTRNKDRNFLYNYLSLSEDDPEAPKSVIMQPDCADNPFFLRAYFAWKMGLPFGYHICDRGYVGKNPRPGQWITNESNGAGSNPVDAFNNYLRKLRDGVQSGTARTALDDENSDYYALPLERSALRPGTVYADPYGHTLILVSWRDQSPDNPGLLLAVDAQPDGTVGIKRFWKGNFLFNTSGVIGEPGFKAFRPISYSNGAPHLMKNKDLTKGSGFVPFSLEQRKMKSDLFYHTMERIINPRPLDAESALSDLIKALYEQLIVRVTSVGNGEAYFKSHPGAVIPMPSNANAIFLAGGQWEDFSTPNRDLRLLIAMDAVQEFPDLVAQSPRDFNISSKESGEQIRKKLQSLLEKQTSELTISYIRTDGSEQKLTVSEILKRKAAFEMAYNPNDGVEIRWGAPEHSAERATCRRETPAYQADRMRAIRTWFTKRLHPPT